MSEIVFISYHNKRVYDAADPDSAHRNESVAALMRASIDNHGTFDVKNENLGGDPAPGQRKECQVRWRDYPGGPLLADAAMEGERLHFTRYVKKITYGDVVLMDRCGAYLALNKAWRNRDSWNEFRTRNPFAGMKDSGQVVLNNDTLGGDPKPGHVKRVKIELHVPDIHEEDNEFEYEEGTRWPPKDVDPEKYIDDRLGSQTLSIAANHMMSASYTYAG